MKKFDTNGNGATKLAEEIRQSIETKQRVLTECLPVIEEIIAAVKSAVANGNKVMLFGNGGSAADSQHIAAEFVSKFNLNRNSLPAIALTTDSSILTSISNDYDFKFVFSRQIEGLGKPGDIALGISTSGNSPNVIEAMSQAGKLGLTTIGFTGENGGALKDCVDFCFRAPSNNTARIQEVHITVAHALCGTVEAALCQESAVMC